MRFLLARKTYVVCVIEFLTFRAAITSLNVLSCRRPPLTTGVLDDGFIVNIPFPTFVPEAIHDEYSLWLPREPRGPTTSPELRPHSQLSRTESGATDTEDTGDSSEVGSKHSKRGLTKRHEKRADIGEFILDNKIMVLGGAILCAGGVWLWNILQRERAERIKHRLLAKDAEEQARRAKDKEAGLSVTEAGNPEGASMLHQPVQESSTESDSDYLYYTDSDSVSE